MKKNSFKNLLLAILVLAVVVLPVLSNATNYMATEESTEVEVGTQGELVAANMYDWNGPGAQHIYVFASLDDTQTMGTLTGQTDPAVFAWWYNFLLEYDEAKGTWVVTKADMLQDGINDNFSETLGEGKMVVMFHDEAVKRVEDSYNFFKATVVDGAEYYLGVDPSYIYDVYDFVDGAFLSSVPVEVKAPEVESEVESEVASEEESEDNTTTDKEKEGVSPLVIAVVVVVVIAIVGVVVVSKRKK